MKIKYLATYLVLNACGLAGTGSPGSSTQHSAAAATQADGTDQNTTFDAGSSPTQPTSTCDSLAVEYKQCVEAKGPENCLPLLDTLTACQAQPPQPIDCSPFEAQYKSCIEAGGGASCEDLLKQCGAPSSPSTCDSLEIDFKQCLEAKGPEACQPLLDAVNACHGQPIDCAPFEEKYKSCIEAGGGASCEDLVKQCGAPTSPSTCDSLATEYKQCVESKGPEACQAVLDALNACQVPPTDPGKPCDPGHK